MRDAVQCENVTSRRSAASRPKLRLPAASPVLQLKRSVSPQFRRHDNLLILR